MTFPTAVSRPSALWSAASAKKEASSVDQAVDVRAASGAEQEMPDAGQSSFVTHKRVKGPRRKYA
jgi:hypothetical protein